MGNCCPKDFETNQLAYLVKHYGNGVTFKSAKSLYPGCSLFSHNISPDDVWQNKSETCYLLASLAAVAVKHPDHIKSLCTDEHNGTYTIKIFETESVMVNGLLPVDSHDKPLFATPFGKNAIWPAIYQKAYAMYFGGYGAIEGSYAYEGLTAITNCFDFSYYRFKSSLWAVYNVPKIDNWKPDWDGNTDWTDVGDDAAFYKLLNDAWNEGFPMTASNNSHVVAIVSIAGKEIKIRDQADWTSTVVDMDVYKYPFIGVCRFK